MSLTLDELRERVRRVRTALSVMDHSDSLGNDCKRCIAQVALRELIAELREINERSGIEMAFAALLAELEDDDVDA